MNKTSKIIISILLIVVLLLGIGYAAIQNITLNITGTTKAEPSQSNFKVMFSGEPTVSDENYVTAAITDEINATIKVRGLTKKGETVSATYTVQNVSTDISADLAVSTTNDNPEYFTLSSKLEKTSLVPGEATKLTVEVELSKVLIKESESTTIGVQLIAMPVEPGQEGTSEGIKISSQTPTIQISTVTNENIGDYIDLGNNIVGTESTTDDWRVLYNDGEKLYLILADYLPANQVPETSGLDTNLEEYPYSVWSNTDRDTLLNGFKNEDAWNSLANGINGATVTGTPTAEILLASYNIKNGTNLLYTEALKLDSDTEDFDLYVSNTSIISNCSGYWLDSPVSSNSTSVRFIDYSGGLHLRSSLLYYEF